MYNKREKSKKIAKKTNLFVRGELYRIVPKYK